MAAPYPYTANVTFAAPGSYLFPSPTDWGAVTVQPEAPAAFALKGQRESSYMDSYLEVQWGRPEDGYAVRFVFHNSLLTDRHSVEIFRTWAAQPAPDVRHPPGRTRLASTSWLTGANGGAGAWAVSVVNDRLQVTYDGLLRLAWDVEAMPALNDAPLLLRGQRSMRVHSLVYADAIRLDRPVVCPAGIWAASYGNLPPVDWADVRNKPAGTTASNHTHAIAEVTGLQAALDAKAASNHTHAIGHVTGLQAALDGRAASNHTHAIGHVTGLQAALDAKAASNHTHAIGHVTGLQAALDAKVSAAGAANNVVLGEMGHAAKWAGFRHATLSNAPQDSYGLLQSDDGVTLVNAAPGQRGALRVANNDCLLWGQGEVTVSKPTFVQTLRLGDLGWGAYYAGVGHKAAAMPAVLQTEDGRTYLGCAPGKALTLGCGDLDYARVDSAGLQVGLTTGKAFKFLQHYQRIPVGPSTTRIKTLAFNFDSLVPHENYACLVSTYYDKNLYDSGQRSFAATVTRKYPHGVEVDVTAPGQTSWTDMNVFLDLLVIA